MIKSTNVRYHDDIYAFWLGEEEKWKENDYQTCQHAADGAIQYDFNDHDDYLKFNTACTMCTVSE